MNNSIGVMQGRLLPKYNGLYQAHPKGYWQDEFFIAKSLGLDCIEFILDFNDVEENPLLSQNGLDEIVSISSKTGVDVKSVCADYFMESPLHSRNELEVYKSIDILDRLLSNASKIGVRDIVIPCVDQSSLNGEVDRFISNTSDLINNFEKRDLNLSLETDLPPKEFVSLLDRINSKNISVNYDIGNRASLGFNPVDELDAYGDRITDIHIKDRILHGGTVVLGTGDADFLTFFNKLREFNYQGIFIMQAYRDDKGVDIFKSQLDWFLNSEYY